MKQTSNNSRSIINQRLRLIRYALCSFVCTCGRLVFYKPKLFSFFTPSSERSCESFPCDPLIIRQWNDSFPLSAVFKGASFGRGTEILFQSVFNAGLILLSCVATLNTVSHYRKPDLTDWPFKVDLSYPSFLLRCLSRRQPCFGADDIGLLVHDLEGCCLSQIVLNESFAVKYPRRQI